MGTSFASDGFATRREGIYAPSPVAVRPSGPGVSSLFPLRPPPSLPPSQPDQRSACSGQPPSAPASSSAAPAPQTRTPRSSPTDARARERGPRAHQNCRKEPARRAASGPCTPSALAPSTPSASNANVVRELTPSSSSVYPASQLGVQCTRSGRHSSPASQSPAPSIQSRVACSFFTVYPTRRPDCQ